MINEKSNYDQDFRRENSRSAFIDNNSNDDTINEARELYATMGLQMEYTQELIDKKDNRKLATMQFVDIPDEKVRMMTQRIIQMYGENSPQIKKWREQLEKISYYKAVQQKAQKKLKKQFVVMALMCIVSILLIACIVFLSINSTTYYVNQGDYSHIYKKTMFGAPELYCDIPATGLEKHGSNIYFLGKDDGVLYCQSTGSGNVQKLSNNLAAEYKFLGSYLYYANTLDGNKLYRVHMEGRDENKVYDDEVTSLQITGNNIRFYDKNDGKDKVLDTKTLTVSEVR